MTKQEVIKILSLIKSTVFLGNCKFLDALDRAIELLKQPEDCDTCKHHGYFGDSHCETCRARFPSHYERRIDG